MLAGKRSLLLFSYVYHTLMVPNGKPAADPEGISGSALMKPADEPERAVVGCHRAGLPILRPRA